jgi:glycosyltransferase involved in cell wall biosynthesis
MSSPSGRILVSIIVPVYNESAMMALLLERLGKVIVRLEDYAWELVLVDDGSTDDSFEQIQQHRAVFPGVIMVRRLSRNFGHQAALMAGLEKATGQALILIDADLQDPPELFPEFLRLFREGYDIVYGVRKTRQEGFPNNLVYKLFYLLFQKMAEIPMPLDAGDFGLLSGRAARIIRGMPDQDLLLRGLRSWIGFKHTGVTYDRPQRAAGQTKYTWKKLLRLAGSAFFGYSALPLRISTSCGFVAFTLALLYGTYVLWGKLIYNTSPPGWTSLMMVVLVFSGTQLISVGILGEYTARIYKQTLNRPLYVVADEYAL